ncbi:TBC domain-containing protein kinase-like protein [Hetaerina americana]|uniref:TBC domain-containing protein kinase-like protein n=1 Tax=Hetaerina americana TaxID=62018 RepID=UPI003A7F2475
MCPEKKSSEMQFGAITFFALSHTGDLCGSNGLPLTPNSITIYGRSQVLKTIHHPYLCYYLDIIRGKHERAIVVSEYHQVSLENAKEYGHITSSDEVVKAAFQVIQALAFLNSLGIVHRALCPENILFDENLDVRLFNYGLYYMTDGGANVSFPIGSPKYIAPEVYLGRPRGSTMKSGPKVDVWSLGIIFVEIVFGQCLWPDLKLPQIIRKVLSLTHCCGTVLERLAREHCCLDIFEQMDPNMKDFLNACLTVSPRNRPTPTELLKHPIFAELPVATIGKRNSFPRCGGHEERSWVQYLKWPPSRINEDPTKEKNLISQRRPQEVYYLWQLAGGDVQSELKKQGLIQSKPPILSIANLMLLEGTVFGQKRDPTSLLDNRVVQLSLDGLRQRLSHLLPDSFYPLVEAGSPEKTKSDHSGAASLPLVIREKDTEYQFHRIVLYERLLNGYPYKKAAIVKEARRDIPPMLRNEVWAAALEVDGNVEGNFIAIDKETPTPTDRQIEVDIPRCHQYDELLSSSEGHQKFKRILKAWVVSHPKYVYWQGLDSLCAPFLYLNFNNEALAYACLSAFIPKYLHNFFLKDNSAVIQEYLAKFSHLIAFHDPSLANHLSSINFVPELFAIPWFLTMFSHVFPLHKIFHLWDKLLLGDASFPLFVGLAVLQQLRDTLLTSGFNECILLFSDLPEIDIERCVTDSVDFFCITPRSVTYRQHELKTFDNKPDLSPDSLKIGNRVEHECTVNPELEMSPIPISMLQSESCPRVSGAELIELLDLEHIRFSRPKAIVVDIRNTDEFNRGAIPESISVPFSSITADDDGKAVIPLAKLLQLQQFTKGKILAVVSTRGVNSAEFGKILIRHGFPRVVTLHGGIEVLRSSRLLVVPASI